MTSLRRRVEYAWKRVKELDQNLRDVYVQLEIVKEGLRMDTCPCCVRMKDNVIGCDYLGFLPAEIFMRECKKCRNEIEYKLKELERLLTNDFKA